MVDYLETKDESEQKKPSRRSVRLKSYDYSLGGAFYITICSQDKRCSFGRIKDGKNTLSKLGEIVRGEWLKSAQIREEVELDDFVVMPNHFHGIVFISREMILRERNEETGTRRVHEEKTGTRRVPLRRNTPPGYKPRSLAAFMSGFKSAVTRRINQVRRTPRAKVWQKGFYEHIIRNEDDFYGVKKYIRENPANWESDSYFLRSGN